MEALDDNDDDDIALSALNMLPRTVKAAPPESQAEAPLLPPCWPLLCTLLACCAAAPAELPTNALPLLPTNCDMTLSI